MYEACVDEVRKPWSAFSDSEKKTGKSYFAKGLYIILSQKYDGTGLIQELFGCLYMNLCTVG